MNLWQLDKLGATGGEAGGGTGMRQQMNFAPICAWCECQFECDVQGVSYNSRCGGWTDDSSVIANCSDDDGKRQEEDEHEGEG